MKSSEIITQTPYRVGDQCKPNELITFNKYINSILFSYMFTSEAKTVLYLQ